MLYSLRYYLLTLAGLLLLGQLPAQDFRYGAINWALLEETRVEFGIEMQLAPRTGNPLPSVGDTVLRTLGLVQFGDGTLGPVDLVVTAVNAVEGHYTGRATLEHTYPSPGNYTATVNTCCRIPGIVNVTQGFFGNQPAEWKLSTRVEVGAGVVNGHSPHFTMSPVVEVAALIIPSIVSISVPLTAIDADGDRLRFRQATAPRERPGFWFPTPQVSEDGTLSLNLFSPEVGQLFAATAIVEDLNAAGEVKSFAQVDFLIRVVASQTACTQAIDRVAITDVNCSEGLNSGQFDVFTAGSQGPLRYRAEGELVTVTQDSARFVNMPPGDYTVTVTQINNPSCTAEIQITVEAINGGLYFIDRDADGYGDPSESILDCELREGYADNPDDCDDDSGWEFPGQEWYIDADFDGYHESRVTSCQRPPNGYIEDRLMGLSLDNCPGTANPDQLDSDGNGVGDACEIAPPPPSSFECNLRTDTVVITNESCPGAADGSVELRLRNPNGTVLYDLYDVNRDTTYSELSNDTSYVFTGLTAGAYEIEAVDLAIGEECSIQQLAQVTVATPLCTPDTTTAFWLEAECATVGTNWVTGRDVAASNDTYLSAPGGRSLAAPPADLPANRVRFTLDGTAAGTYYLHARAFGTRATGDSFWVRANGGAWIKWNGIGATSKFSWTTLPETLALLAGTNTVDVAFREGMTQLDKVYLSQTASTPSSYGAAATNCTALPPPPPQVFEAECAQRSSDWKPYNIGEGNGLYVSYRGARDLAEPTAAQTDRLLNYRFTTDRPGTYYAYLRLDAPDPGRNSFWVRMDDGPWLKMWREADGSQLLTSGFAWRRVNDDTQEVSFTLDSGEHTLTVAPRESDTRLDKLIVSSSADLPSGTLPPALNCGSVSRPLSALATDTPDANLTPSSEPRVALYPNPATERLTVDLYGDYRGELQLTVFNTLGRQVRQLYREAAGGHLREELSLTGLPAGTYQLRIEQGGVVTVRRFVKQ